MLLSQAGCVRAAANAARTPRYRGFGLPVTPVPDATFGQRPYRAARRTAASDDPDGLPLEYYTVLEHIETP